MEPVVPKSCVTLLHPKPLAYLRSVGTGRSLRPMSKIPGNLADSVPASSSLGQKDAVPLSVLLCRIENATVFRNHFQSDR
jgi:hypothetical protein